MQCISQGIDIPVSPTTAYNVLLDLEVLLRLSPYWSLKEFKCCRDEKDKYEVTIEYYGKNVIETYLIDVFESIQDKKISFKIQEGMLKQINFIIEKGNGGIHLIQQFIIDSENENILRSSYDEITFWLRSIGEYLKLTEGETLWKRFFKWFMDKVWLRLTLSERKIAIIVTKITIIELMLLGILIVLWNILAR